MKKHIIEIMIFFWAIGAIIVTATTSNETQELSKESLIYNCIKTEVLKLQKSEFTDTNLSEKLNYCLTKHSLDDQTMNSSLDYDERDFSEKERYPNNDITSQALRLFDWLSEQDNVQFYNKDKIYHQLYKVEQLNELIYHVKDYLHKYGFFPAGEIQKEDAWATLKNYSTTVKTHPSVDHLRNHPEIVTNMSPEVIKQLYRNAIQVTGFYEKFKENFDVNKKISSEKQQGYTDFENYAREVDQRNPERSVLSLKREYFYLPPVEP